jgi:thioesterase domain-containing protein
VRLPTRPNASWRRSFRRFWTSRSSMSIRAFSILEVIHYSFSNSQPLASERSRFVHRSRRFLPHPRCAGWRHACKLIALAASAGKPVLLFVHAASGSVLPYLEVSRHLAGEFSIYGIQAPGLDDDDVVPDAVGKFATSYCAIAESLAASNTLFLAGWSFGGNVAYELGRLLRARGHELAGMILLDSWVPARSAAVKVPAAASVTEHELDILRAAGLVPRGMPATALERVRRVLQCTVTAFRQHVPEHYGARVDLVRSAEALPPVFGAPEEACLSPDHGWSSCVNELMVHTVSGHHFNMLDASHAAEVARTIKHIAQALHACAPSAGCARAGETPRARTER